ncbi:MAG: phage portal protein [Myxococcota bacterium]
MGNHDLTWLDRAIGWISPTRGAQRAQARALMGTLLSYEGARSGRRKDGWVTASTSADAEITQFLGQMRDNARDLVRNNPHAARALSVIVKNKIGTGIMCQPADARIGSRRTNRRKNQRLHDRWKRWVDHCDIDGKHDFYGLQALAERTRSEAGESLLRFIPSKMEHPLDVPLRLQLLEPDHIDSTKHVRRSEESVIRHGVEFDRRGRPAAFWLYPKHPGDDAPIPYRAGGLQSERIPAADVIHYYKVQRPGQTRGMTDFAPVMTRLRALDDYDDAEVMRKKIAACLAAFVYTPGNLPAASLAPTTVDAAGRRIESFSPGMIAYPEQGSQVEIADPKPSGDYEPFTKVQLRAIASGLDLPYELLTGDLAEVSYISGRLGLVQFKMGNEADQWLVVIPQVCDRVCRRFTAEAAGVDPMIDPDTLWTFTPPRFALLDPAKEVKAKVDAIKGGVASFQETVRQDGYEPSDLLQEIKEFQDWARENGVALDSIPNGAAAQQPAPGEGEEEAA